MKKSHAALAILLIALIIGSSAYGTYTLLSPSPSPSPSSSPLPSASPAATPKTPAPTPSNTPTPTLQPTPTSTPSPVASPTLTPTPSATPTTSSTASPTPSAPTPTATATPEPQTVTVTDATGAQITVTLPVNRIVSLTSGLTELLCALGCQDKIVGRDSYSNFPASITNQPVVGDSSSEPNLELLLEQQPDLVFADTMLTYNPEAKTALEKAGVPVVIELMNNATCIKTCITDLGVILEKQANAAALIDYLESYENLVNQRLQNLTDSEKPSVYIEWDTWQSYAEGSGADGNLVSAGGINIASGSSSSYPTLSPEYVVEKNPDIILLLQFGTDTNLTAYQTAVDSLLNRGALSSTTAVKEKRVYDYSPTIFQGIRYPIGLLYFAKWFHPALFADIDPAAVHEELLQEFFGVEMEGVFAYPEIVTVIDGTGAEVTLPLPVNRIVSLNSGMTEILCALGCEDRIVGRDESSTLPPSVLDIPTVGQSSYYPNLELLLEMGPDLLVADSSFTYVPGAINQVKAAGIPIFISDTSDPQATTHSNSTPVDFTCNLVYTLSRIVGKEDRAEEYITYVQYYNNLVKDRIATLTQSQRPKVMLEWYAPYNTFVTPNLDQAGGINIAENQTVYAPELSIEFVVEQNPDIIIRLILSLDHVESDFIELQTQILNRHELSGVSAIENGKVFICDYAIRDGIHCVIGYLYWAQWCQPELFADLDVAAINADLNQKFFGENISGVFVYP